MKTLSATVLLGLLGVVLSGTLPNGRVYFCYWESWSIYRAPPYTYGTEDMDPNLCTHLIYTFIGLDNETYTPIHLDPYTDTCSCEMSGLDNFRKFVALREENPDLEVLLAIGGWNQASWGFSHMANTSESRQVFIAQILRMLLTYDFDGLDLDWEYPTLRGGAPEDREHFTLLVKELREAFDGVVREPGRGPLILTSAIAAGIETIDSAYEISNISKYLDYLLLMTYDYVVPKTGFIAHHSPIYAPEGNIGDNDTLNVDTSISHLISLGAPPEKLVLGLALYGKAVKLLSPDLNQLYDPHDGPADAGSVSQEPGTLFYYEICQMISEVGWTVVDDPQMMVPYAYSADTWVGYDNEQSVINKVQYLANRGMAGAFLWAMDIDDCALVCGGTTACPLSYTIREWLETA